MSDTRIDCDRCAGTGIGQYGPIDASRCTACGGKGWTEEEEDWYDEDLAYERSGRGER